MEYRGSQLVSIHTCSICGRSYGVPYKACRKWRYVIPERRKGKIRHTRVCSYGCQQKGIAAYAAQSR